MSRDRILTALKDLGPFSGISARETAEVAARIGRARAVSLDQKAFSLIRSYLKDMGDVSLPDMVNGLRSPWPEMWLQLPDTPSGSPGPAALIHQNGHIVTAEMWRSGKPGNPPSAPLARSIFDQKEGTWHQELTEYGDAALERRGVWRAVNPDMSRLCEAEGRKLEVMVLTAAAMAALMRAADMLRVPAEIPPGQIWRQRFRKAGVSIPKSACSSIDLSDAGLREYRHRVLNEPHAEGEAIEGGRRAHWVRAHMFLARNGEMTLRRAHIRGGGEVMQTMMRITASEVQDPDPV